MAYFQSQMGLLSDIHNHRSRQGRAGVVDDHGTSSCVDWERALTLLSNNYLEFKLMHLTSIDFLVGKRMVIQSTCGPMTVLGSVQLHFHPETDRDYFSLFQTTRKQERDYDRPPISNIYRTKQQRLNLRPESTTFLFKGLTVNNKSAIRTTFSRFSEISSSLKGFNNSFTLGVDNI